MFVLYLDVGTYLYSGPCFWLEAYDNDMVFFSRTFLFEAEEGI